MPHDDLAIPPRPPLPHPSAPARAADHPGHTAHPTRTAHPTHTARATPHTHTAQTTPHPTPEPQAPKAATLRTTAARLHPRHHVRDPRAWLLAYSLALAAVAFWPVPVDSLAKAFLDLVPLVFPALTYERIEFGANILMFVPLGILLTMILKSRRHLVMPIAFLATVTIECVQAAALAERTPSVFDIIANTAGACLGILICAFIDLLARSRTPAPA